MNIQCLVETPPQIFIIFLLLKPFCWRNTNAKAIITIKSDAAVFNHGVHYRLDFKINRELK